RQQRRGEDHASGKQGDDAAPHEAPTSDVSNTPAPQVPVCRVGCVCPAMVSSPGHRSGRPSSTFVHVRPPSVVRRTPAQELVTNTVFGLAGCTTIESTKSYSLVRGSWVRFQCAPPSLERHSPL